MTENVRIDIWYGKRQTFGRSGLPQRYVNILGRVVGSVRHLHYSLNGAEKRDLSIGPDQRRLVAIGDFNIDLNIANLRHGENTVEITATGDHGDPVTETVVVDFDRRAGRIPCSIDWSQVETIQEAAQVVDGLWSITNSSISPVEIGYDRLIALGDMNWRDYEVTVPITIHGINGSCYQFPSVHAGVGIILRWKGHWNWGCDQWASGQPYFGPSPYGAIGWYCFFRESGIRTKLL